MLFLPHRLRLAKRARQTDNQGDALGAGSLLFLLLAADDERRELHAFPFIEEPGAGGAIELRAVHRHKVSAKPMRRERKKVPSLTGVGVEKRKFIPSHFLKRLREFHHRKHRTYLIVDIHNRDEDGLARDVAEALGDPYHSVLVHGEHGHLESFGKKNMRSLYDRLVLDGRDDEVVAAAAIRPCRANKRKIVGLGAGTGKDDFGSAGADEAGADKAGFFYRLARAPAVFVYG